MQTIYYWNGAIGAEALLREHHATILNLLRGNYAPDDLEKWSGGSVQDPTYSFRLNQTHRLIFKTFKNNYLLVLEYIPEHDYQKSRFLKHNVAKRYIKKNEDLLQETIQNEQFRFDPVPESERPVFTQSDAPSKNIPVDYYNQTFITLTESQDEAVQTRLPAIVHGPAGAGKTYVALAKIAEYLSQHSNPLRILFLTKEAELINAVKAIWASLSIAFDIPDHQRIEFNIYPALIHALDGLTLLANELDTKDKEDRIIPGARSIHRNWHASGKKSTSGISFDAHVEYQEFRICSGCTLPEYLQCGEHQSTIATREERSELYRRFLAYKTHLEHEKLIDPAFFSLPEHAAYDLILVDEAQSFSLQQLKSLLHLAKAQSIIYCMDTRQNQVDVCATRTLFEALYFKTHQTPINTVQLTQTHRCPAKIATVVNALADIEFGITGGKTDKQESYLSVDESKHPGHVYFANLNELNELTDITNRSATNHFAVVTRAELVEFAKTLFHTKLVFTPKTIGGHEYHTVVALGLIHDPALKADLNDIFPELEHLSHHRHAAHRSKENKEKNTHLRTMFRRIHTALSRASNTLILCEDQALLAYGHTPEFSKKQDRAPQVRSAILQFLKESLSQPANELPDIAAYLPETNWLAEAIKHRDIGTDDSREMARNICKANLGWAVQDIEAFLQPKPMAMITPAKTSPIVVTEPITAKKTKLKRMPVQLKLSKDQQTVLECIRTISSSIAKVEIEKAIQSALARHKRPSTLLFNVKVPYNEQQISLFHFLTELDSISSFWSLLPDVMPINTDFVNDVSPIIETISPKSIFHLIACILNSSYRPVKKNIPSWIGRHFKENKDTPPFLTFFNSLCSDEAHQEINHSHQFDLRAMMAYWEKKNDVDTLISLEQIGRALSEVFHAIELNVKNSSAISEQPRLAWLLEHNFGGFLHFCTKTQYKILHYLSSDAWHKKALFGASSEPLAGHSALFSLVRFDLNHSILHYLLEKLPSVINKIPADAWSACQETAPGLSPLYYLTMNIDNHPVHQHRWFYCLKQFIQNHPNIIKDIPVSAWVTIPAGEHSSPLLFIARHSNGKELIELLFNTEAAQNTHLLARLCKDFLPELTSIFHADGSQLVDCLSVAAWGKIIHEDIDGMQGTSPLFWLVKKPAGYDTLRALIKCHPNFLEQIPLNTWETPCLAHGENVQTTLLFNLVWLAYLTRKSANYHHFLHYLLDTHSSVFQRISLHTWLLTPSLSTRYPYGSHAKSLLSKTIPFEILNKFLPLLFAEEVLEKDEAPLLSFDRMRLFMLKKYENIADCVADLERLFQQETSLTSLLFHTPIYHNGVQYTLFSAVVQSQETVLKQALQFFLRANEKRINFAFFQDLADIIESDRAQYHTHLNFFTFFYFLFLEQEFDASLIDSVPTPIIDYLKTGELMAESYWLNVELAFSILNKWCRTQNKLIHQLISTETIVGILTSTDLIGSNLIDFTVYCNHLAVYCKKALLNLMAFLEMTNDSPLPHIPGEIWGQIIHAVWMENTSALFWLTRQKEGYRLLQRLLDHHPDILCAIPSASWGHLSTKDDENKNTSPLFWVAYHALSGHEPARLFFQALLECYPGIIQNMSSSTYPIDWNLPEEKAHQQVLYISGGEAIYHIAYKHMNEAYQIQQTPAVTNLVRFSLVCDEKAKAADESSSLDLNNLSTHISPEHIFIHGI